MNLEQATGRAILFCCDAVSARWQLGSLPPKHGFFVLIGWTMEDPEGGVPSPVVEILARALTRSGRVTFPSASAESANIGWSSKGLDYIGAFSLRPAGGLPFLCRLHSYVTSSRNARRLPLLSTIREEAARELFDDAAFPWRLQGQFALISRPTTPPPEFGGFQLPDRLFDDDWADSLQELGPTGIEAIIRPGVDGDVIGLACASMDVRRRIEDDIRLVAGELDIGSRELREETFAAALASTR